MKVALVHDWLTGMRGGERVLLSLARLFPQAAVFAFLITSIIALIRARGAPPENPVRQRHSGTIA